MPLEDASVRPAPSPEVPPSLSSSTAAYAECPTCGKKCHPTNLSRHLVTHTGLRRYDCPHCDAAFTTSSNLKRHVTHFHKEACAAEETLSRCGKSPVVNTKSGNEHGAAEVVSTDERRERKPNFSSSSSSSSTAVHVVSSADSKQQNPVVYSASGGCCHSGNERGAEPEHVALHPQPCGFGCGKEFVWPSTRKAHEAVCRRRNGTATTNVEGGIADVVDLSRAAARPAQFVCSDCEAVLSSASKLQRHAWFHCPFRVDDALGPNDDAGSPVSFGATGALFPLVPMVSAEEVLTVAVPTQGKMTDRQKDRFKPKPLLYICPHCSDAFQRERHLSAHVARRHAALDVPAATPVSRDNVVTRTTATALGASDEGQVECSGPALCPSLFDERKRPRETTTVDVAASCLVEQHLEEGYAL